MGWRKSTWAILLWTGLAIWLIASLPEAVEQGASATGRDPALNALIAGVSGVILGGIWWVGFLILVLIWFMSRPSTRVVVYGPRGEQAMVTESEAKRRVRRGWSYTPDAAQSEPPSVKRR